MIPVPEEGEVHVRYGKPGSVTIEKVPGEFFEPGTGMNPGSTVRRDTMRMGRDTSASVSGSTGGASLDSSALAALERRIIERLEKSGKLTAGRALNRRVEFRVTEHRNR